jgi:AcrR family transcriptional regulator
MGRQRTFDEAEVIAMSASVFLRQGYEGTSIDDLLAATGLHRGSLYKAFASKRGLFLAALTRTLPDLAGGHATQAAQAAPAADDALDLLLVALLELAPRDPEVRALCGAALAHLSPDQAADQLGQRLLARAHLAGH